MASKPVAKWTVTNVFMHALNVKISAMPLLTLALSANDILPNLNLTNVTLANNQPSAYKHLSDFMQSIRDGWSRRPKRE